LKPKIFIGSSVEGINVAEAIQENLTYVSTPTLWSQGIFKLSSYTLEDLIKAVHQHDYAILVFTPDDITSIRNNEVKTVRDNVIFETGLFIGKLGREKVYFLIPEGIKDLHLPSDLLGVTYGTYNSKANLDELLQSTGVFCSKVKREIARTTNSDEITLTGKWQQKWILDETKSGLFEKENADNEVEVIQLRNKITADYISGGRNYKSEGTIRGNFITGIWRDIQNGATYHGAFQLKIGMNAITMSGIWLGFDSSLNEIKCNSWEWVRI
jgi:hypothetical protein